MVHTCKTIHQCNWFAELVVPHLPSHGSDDAVARYIISPFHPHSFSFVLSHHISFSPVFLCGTYLHRSLHTLFSNMVQLTSLVLASLVALVSAHQNLHEIYINDVSAGYQVGIRMPPSNSPVVSSPAQNHTKRY